MDRMARVVAPGIPHHMPQQRKRREPMVFGEDGSHVYLALMEFRRILRPKCALRGSVTRSIIQL
jgi:hypothetical protein